MPSRGRENEQSKLWAESGRREGGSLSGSDVLLCLFFFRIMIFSVILWVGGPERGMCDFVLPYQQPSRAPAFFGKLCQSRETNCSITLILLKSPNFGHHIFFYFKSGRQSL